MMKSKLIFLSVILPFLAIGQQVTTLNPNAGADDALFFDASGNLYGSHYQGSAVYKLNPDNWSSAEFSGGYNTPNGLAFGTDGLLYMADNLGDKVYRIFADGSKEIFVNNFNSPSGMILEQDSDTLIVTSYEGNRIVKVGADGEYIEAWSDSLLNGPVGLCYDEEGNLYTGNFNDRKIIKLLDNGQQELITQAPGNGYLGFITYAKGYIYGTLFSQHKIYRTDLLGNDTIILGGSAGSVDGGVGVARFNAPNGIIASPSQDTLYVSDYNTRSLRMITDLLPIVNNTSEVSKAPFDISLFPNPVYDELQVELILKNPGNIRLEVTNAIGVKMPMAKTIKPGSEKQLIRLETTNLPMGVYYLRAKLDNGSILCKSFVMGKKS